MSESEEEPTEFEELISRHQELLESVRAQKRQRQGQELLDQLPQGEDSGLDADLLDGLHAIEIIEKAIFGASKVPLFTPGGGGGGASMTKHGNEWHTLPFAQKCCQICEVDALSEDGAPGHAVLLADDSHIYVCTEGLGELPCGGCVFENVAVLPDADVGLAVFLLDDKHVHIGV